VSAGICEELIYRGFLLGVLSALGGAWLGVLISSLIFGLAHSYQGPAGIAKTAGVGLVMAGLTVLTGSLWAAIFLHIVIDITSGLIAQRVVYVAARSLGEVGTAAG
jgi:membrane protease YdiL (CAAX protease family)